MKIEKIKRLVKCRYLICCVFYLSIAVTEQKYIPSTVLSPTPVFTTLIRNQGRDDVKVVVRYYGMGP